MKKTRKTYGIRGMMTYVAMIAVGKAHMKVTFSDGSISATGSKPAVFTTDNYIVQQGIEQSEQFKSGLIFVCSSYPLDEELKVETNGSNDADMLNQQDDDGAEPAEPDGAEQNGEDGGVATTTLDAGADGGQQPVRVEFEVNEDAKDYLESNFGAMRSKLRTRADIVAFGEEHGIEIVFI